VLLGVNRYATGLTGLRRVEGSFVGWRGFCFGLELAREELMDVQLRFIFNKMTLMLSLFKLSYYSNILVLVVFSSIC
jgi:hypothetical protein